MNSRWLLNDKTRLYLFALHVPPALLMVSLRSLQPGADTLLIRLRSRQGLPKITQGLRNIPVLYCIIIINRCLVGNNID